MRKKLYSFGIVLFSGIIPLSFAQSQSVYTIQEMSEESENLDINTYRLYPEKKSGDELAVVLYPNPVDDLLNVRISRSKGDKISYNLVDISGKLVASKIEDTSNFSINMVNLISGVYLLVIQDETSKKTFKVIKK
ncbi:T9SS type A sorting domain-containing protein [Chryseobacterium salviniae]|uniref:T9SS type A sorting domain-containing protein n=1 Tax=Chryseobacterium salviniae TaxID=3101750 RepID=A0ABU6HTL1_9FLAO|nr:T9SS type A sorting domain-containing protein [Chryseobacterium sp. T9W2-O]MEC3876041.1 T9SS type A sorting domain-containing protein [Chryseobacterium sp. T9W2-O]